MRQYHKIQSIFKRDPKTKALLIDEYSLPEFEFLQDNEWEWTEKVDGTNIRVIWDGLSFKFRGKTDKAQIPGFLLDALQNIFNQDMASIFQEKFGETSVCLYGEGYGPKIQNGGNYRRDNSFVLFDVMINNWFLLREDVQKYSNYGIEVVPIIDHGTLDEAVTYCKYGFPSTWGDFTAEGLVLRPTVPLYTRMGDRIITKIKHKDFQGGE